MLKVQKQYEGFLKTQSLWYGNAVMRISMFETTPTYSALNACIEPTLRLGKFVERLVSFELSQQKNIRVLTENLQVQDGKTTIGELDCLLIKNDTPIHLEIIYKFYVYDASVGTNEIEHFIGPNRKDSLIQKLEKLKDKQLPLLHSKFCKPYLKALNLSLEKIVQQVYFKAQLFMPFSNQEITLTTLNPNCIVGFYLNTEELNRLASCKFYIPNKIDWLILPHNNVSWLNFETFKRISKNYLDRKFSPLCWIKMPNGLLKKIILVWW